MKKPTARLIVGILLSILIPWCYFCQYFIENSIPWWILAVISAVLIVLCIILFAKERISDKKHQKALGDLKDSRYFSSPEWREKYFEYVQKNPFETPRAKGMKADLTARYRRMPSPFIYFIGIFMFLVAYFIYISYKDDKELVDYPMLTVFFAYIIPLIAVIIGIAILRVNVEKLRAPAVKEFYRSMDAVGNTGEIERSYANGKILSHKYNGINIGTDYTVIYDPNAVYLIENDKINTISRHVIRQKKYYKELIYQGEKYVHRLYIKDNSQFFYYVELNEFQVEMAIDEFSRCAIGHSENSVYEETI